MWFFTFVTLFFDSVIFLTQNLLVFSDNFWKCDIRRRRYTSIQNKRWLYCPFQFACAISDKSLKNDPGNLSSSSSSSGSRLFSGKSKGLSGGAIAGIVIACIAAVAIVGTIIALSYKGVFSKGVDATQASIDNNSTVNKLNMNNQNANIV